MREDDDKALRSFREEPSARDLDKENSPYTAEVAPSPAESPAYYGSGYSTPRMRSVATTPNGADSLGRGGAYGRSPFQDADDAVPTLVTPTTHSAGPSPSFDLALPIPPIASLTPEVPAPSPTVTFDGVGTPGGRPRVPGSEGMDGVMGIKQQAGEVLSSVDLSDTPGGAAARLRSRLGASQSSLKASTNSAPGEFQLALPQIPKGIMDRIATLGPELPSIQKWVLWLGIVLDVVGKITLVYELNRFATKDDWAWFSCVMIFFILSGLMATGYWLAHYPNPISHGKEPEVKIFGFSKTDVKRIIRRFGAVCAAFQLGTAFAASRALYTKDVKQRKITMDLRGMRLVDTVFLTLSMCSLQAYIGISCSSPDNYCPGRVGFDAILSLSIFCSLASGTLCFTSLDLMDEWKTNCNHLVDMSLFFLYRLCELAARIVNLALFAALCGEWVFAVLCFHVVIVGLMLKSMPWGAKAWSRSPGESVTFLSLGGVRFNLPVINDVVLLVLCLAWPPSCFVSNATDELGHFWWRSHMAPRKSFSSLRAQDAFIPMPIFNLLMTVETCIILGASYTQLTPWASPYFKVAVVLTLLWQFFAATWVSFNRGCEDNNGQGIAYVASHDHAHAHGGAGYNDHVAVIISPGNRKNGMMSPFPVPVRSNSARTPLKEMINTPMTSTTTPDLKQRSVNRNRMSLSQDDGDLYVPHASVRRTSLTSFSLNDDALRESLYTPHPGSRRESRMFSP